MRAAAGATHIYSQKEGLVKFLMNTNVRGSLTIPVANIRATANHATTDKPTMTTCIHVIKLHSNNNLIVTVNTTAVNKAFPKPYMPSAFPFEYTISCIIREHPKKSTNDSYRPSTIQMTKVYGVASLLRRPKAYVPGRLAYMSACSSWSPRPEARKKEGGGS
jgi:hypothetical protein